MYGECFDDIGDVAGAKSGADDNNDSAKSPVKGDIEHEIQEELEAMQKGHGISTASAGRKQVFTHVKLNLQCGKFVS